MTVGDLKEQLAGVPDDAVVCRIALDAFDNTVIRRAAVDLTCAILYSDGSMEEWIGRTPPGCCKKVPILLFS